jgi:hypothetical protein
VANGLRILITNNTLHRRMGSELFARDLALGLLRRGHHPIACSTVLGDVADELRRATVPVVDDLAKVGDPPDVIHGQHHVDAMAAVLRFPQVPALFMCHGWSPWEEEPPRFPSIVRYVAVDDACRDRVVETSGVPAARVHTIYNAVDLRRFAPRPPLPSRPRTALVLSNAATESGFVAPIRAACAARGFERVDVAGHASGHPSAAPETLLARYDVVFAKARAALEAMATGCAVIVTDAAGFGGLVTPDSVERMRCLNFGIRTMQGTAVTEAAVGAALDAYDPDASLLVSRWIREHADLETALDRIVGLYGELVEEGPAWMSAGGGPSNVAASEYVAWLGRFFKGTAAQRDEWLRTIARQGEELERARADTVRVRGDLENVQRQLQAVQASTTWRAFAWYRRLQGWARRDAG